MSFKPTIQTLLTSSVSLEHYGTLLLGSNTITDDSDTDQAVASTSRAVIRVGASAIWAGVGSAQVAATAHIIVHTRISLAQEVGVVKASFRGGVVIANGNGRASTRAIGEAPMLRLPSALTSTRGLTLLARLELCRAAFVELLTDQAPVKLVSEQNPVSLTRNEAYCHCANERKKSRTRVLRKEENVVL